MSNLLAEFERACEAANITPTDALDAGGVHRSLWLKWKRGNSPTLKNFEAAHRGLEIVKSRRSQDAAA